MQRYVGLIVFVLLSLQAIALGHPADILVPREPELGYGTWRFGTPADRSFGDVVFYAPYPDPSELSNAEKYMLWGSSNSPEGDFARGPWWIDIVNVASSYYVKTGELPAQLDEQVIKSVAWQPNAIGMGALQWYKSPLTDEFPKLNSIEFSTGNLFLKVLNEAEIQEACKSNSALNSVHNLGFVAGARIGSPDVEELQVRLSTPVIYVRIYGEHEVIYSELFWQFTKL